MWSSAVSHDVHRRQIKVTKEPKRKKGAERRDCRRNRTAYPRLLTTRQMKIHREITAEIYEGHRRRVGYFCRRRRNRRTHGSGILKSKSPTCVVAVEPWTRNLQSVAGTTQNSGIMRFVPAVLNTKIYENYHYTNENAVCHLAG